MRIPWRKWLCQIDVERLLPVFVLLLFPICLGMVSTPTALVVYFAVGVLMVQLAIFAKAIDLMSECGSPMIYMAMNVVFGAAVVLVLGVIQLAVVSF